MQPSPRTCEKQGENKETGKNNVNKSPRPLNVSAIVIRFLGSLGNRFIKIQLPLPVCLLNDKLIHALSTLESRNSTYIMYLCLHTPGRGFSRISSDGRGKKEDTKPGVDRGGGHATVEPMRESHGTPIHTCRFN